MANNYQAILEEQRKAREIEEAKEAAFMKKVITGVVTGVIFLITTIFLACNLDNVKVDGGYAAYVYSDPIFGKKEFVDVLTGPNSTGVTWRKKACIVSTTPWRMAESFDNIQSKDNLMTSAEASIVFVIDRTKIREFVENYGAMAEVDASPEALIRDAYESFVQKPFQTAVRTAVSQYRGLDAALHIPEITGQVEKSMQKELAGTPFVLKSINIGRTTPPKEVVAGIVAKVEATQTDEKRDIDLSIARKNEEIREAEGRAEARRAQQVAEGERLAAQSKADAELYQAQRKADAELYQAQKAAEGELMLAKARAEGKKAEAAAVKSYSESVGDNYVRLKFVENIKDLKLPNTLVGSEIIQGVMKAAGDVFTNK